MKSMPDGVAQYAKTREFSETSTPANLLRRHPTKPGTWGRIVVSAGQLRYRILEPAVEEVELSPERPGVIEPQVPHEVEPLGKVCFHVEFWRHARDEAWPRYRQALSPEVVDCSALQKFDDMIELMNQPYIDEADWDRRCGFPLTSYAQGWVASLV